MALLQLSGLDSIRLQLKKSCQEILVDTSTPPTYYSTIIAGRRMQRCWQRLLDQAEEPM